MGDNYAPAFIFQEFITGAIMENKKKLYLEWSV